ncbi:hypothetical protein RFM41_16245 [Mesorhizobium sp. VK25A]|uniref:Tat pathway signal protein n=2 Tax=Mesorhizobium vachelliae TaxID=3072309 RepID=A0ABU5A3X1_9HYPH|nr:MULTISPECIES: hypothetical protein [unclassified Mesorhizobium]MDX8532395.1 hypothetical protein [Mesorhizobium sp. VK25D]MDX8545301.1 hypothetical protein [Mesorhizobium sp. VK25A]
MTSLRPLTSTFAMSLAMVPAWAQSAPAPALSLELNAAQPSDRGCRLTFVVNNALGADLSKAAFEIALFNEAGVVDRLTVLDFKDLPAGKTKVTRFDLAGADCGKLSRVLINSATECAGTGVEPAACMRGLKISTKTAIAFGV